MGKDKLENVQDALFELSLAEVKAIAARLGLEFGIPNPTKDDLVYALTGDYPLTILSDEMVRAKRKRRGSV